MIFLGDTTGPLDPCCGSNIRVFISKCCFKITLLNLNFLNIHPSFFEFCQSHYHYFSMQVTYYASFKITYLCFSEGAKKAMLYLCKDYVLTFFSLDINVDLNIRFYFKVGFILTFFQIL